MMSEHGLTWAAALAAMVLSGCGFQHHKRPSATARPAILSSESRCGIPFYLPKPLLVVSKNVHHVEESRVGQNGVAPIPARFDKQENYAAASINASVTNDPKEPTERQTGDPTPPDDSNQPFYSDNGAPVSPRDKVAADGLAPHTFFTYEVVFVPDLTQKYVMQIEGGAGELRAAMNLVNGWQFTGLGPFYLKDSSTAQNVFARGVAVRLGLGGVSEVVNSIAGLASVAGANGGSVSASEVAKLAEVLASTKMPPKVDWSFAKHEDWEDELVPMMLLATDEKGNPLLNEAGEVQFVSRYVATGRQIRPRLERYAEIRVYEPNLVDGEMIWQPVAEHVFDRQYLGVMNATGGQGEDSLFGDGTPPTDPSLAYDSPLSDADDLPLAQWGSHWDGDGSTTVERPSFSDLINSETSHRLPEPISE